MRPGAGLPHAVVVLHAAEGPARPGAATPLYYKPLGRWALDALAGVPRRSLGVCGSAGEAELSETLKGLHGVRYYGAASQPRAAALAAAAAQEGEGDILVVDGGRPLLQSAALAALLARHAAGTAPCTTLAQGGAWVWRRAALAGGETRGEEMDPADGVSLLEVKDLPSLAAAESLLQERLNAELLRRGVRLSDPRTTRVDPACRLAPGATVEGGCELVESGLAEGARVEAGCRLSRSELGPGARLRRCSLLEDSRLAAGASAGPFARLSAGSSLEEGASVGAYAELEDAVLGRGSRLGGHSYLGHSRVGKDAEIGCGFLTCGSGAAPGRLTLIEDGVFIGAASQVVGTVTIGRGSFVATGTSLTDDAPPDSFVISRGRQVVKAGHGRRHARRD